MKLKVITLNTWLFQYYEEIVKFIHEENPDILLLQEVSSSQAHPIPHGISDGYERLRQNLSDYQNCFAPMRFYKGDGINVWMGTAIFSKYPILTSQWQYYYETFETVNLSATDVIGSGHTNFPGLLIGAQIDLGSTTLECLATHFLWSKHPEITTRQKQAVANLLEILALKDNFILGGDFNVTDDSEIYTQLAQVLIDDRPPETDQTLHPQIHKVGTSKKLAVDYLFHKGSQIKLLSSHVPIVPISDHLPIVAEYEINT